MLKNFSILKMKWRMKKPLFLFSPKVLAAFNIKLQTEFVRQHIFD